MEGTVGTILTSTVLGRPLATVSHSRAQCSRPHQVPEPKQEGSTHLAVPGVYFTCPLTGATLRRDQRDAHIKEAILSVSAVPCASPPQSQAGRSSERSSQFHVGLALPPPEGALCAGQSPESHQSRAEQSALPPLRPLPSGSWISEALSRDVLRCPGSWRACPSALLTHSVPQEGSRAVPA